VVPASGAPEETYRPSARSAQAIRGIGIASTFVASSLEASVRFWSEQIGLSAEVAFAPYGQVVEPLVGAGSALTNPSIDVGVVLVRPEDWLRGEDGALTVDPRVMSVAMGQLYELSGALAQGAETVRGGLLLGLMPTSDPARAVADVAEFVALAHRELLAAAERHDRIEVLPIESLLEVYEVAEIHDGFSDRLAHIPFTDECMAVVGTAIVRALRARWSEPRKVIVLDCDNTLWAGACGEDPLDSLDPSGPFEHLRGFMADQASKGRLLCLASRNRESDVWDAFARYAAPLTEGQITARRISWGRKSDSLSSLSDELGLALDAFVFVDDDPVECAEVADALPDVLVVNLPRDTAEIPRVLGRVWEFDPSPVTREDQLRAAAYAVDVRRREEQAAAPSVEEFVRGLKVKVEVRPLEPRDLPRAQQLFQRTNQFNATGARLTEAEILEFAAVPGQAAWVALVEDRLGVYGLVGLMLTAADEQALHVKAWLLSCRVFNRGVEAKMLSAIGETAARLGLEDLVLEWRRTERNGPAQDFFDRLVAGESSRDEGSHDTGCIPVASLPGAVERAMQ
jgi:FkbH-like protein